MHDLEEGPGVDQSNNNLTSSQKADGAIDEIGETAWNFPRNSDG